MKNPFPHAWRSAEALVSLFVLGLLILLTYGILFAAPYPGFYMDPTSGEVITIYMNQGNTVPLRVGDILGRVGPILLKDFHEDKSLVLFKNIQPGQIVDLTIQRDGKETTVPWVYAGFNMPEFLDRFFNIWMLSYVFWFFGTATLLFMRPHDLRWVLLSAADYLTGLFIIIGSLSGWHIWESSLFMRAIVWLMLPMYIHFHWISPTHLWRAPSWGWLVLYLASFSLALLELLSLTPKPLFYLGLLLTLGGSVIILMVRAIRITAQRRNILLLVILSSLALFPLFGISLIAARGQMPQSGPLALLFLPILPGAYFYTAYRSRLGGMELRANRAISIYAFLSILGGVLFFIASYSVNWDIQIDRGTLLFGFLLTILIAAFLSILLYPRFETFVEQRILGIKLPYQKLPETYSTRIITSKTLSDLLKVLEVDVFPSLFVRQYAFVGITGTATRVLLSKEVDQPQALEKAVANIPFSSQTDSLVPPFSGSHPLSWVRIILPLKVGDELLGLWLLGRRDPDDYYSQAEIPILQSLANQTAIALSNLLQTERLKSMYQANVDRYEQERHRLALDLHDSVLNEMAALLMILDPAAQTPEFQKAYDSLSQRVREIVTELRPPMLNFGLKLGLEELADYLMERNKDTVEINVTIQGDEDVRYSQSVEHHIYRMAQEACENAVRHGQARHIHLSGALAFNHLNLFIEDDGHGFDASSALRLDHLLANKHFGLAGIVERALLIEAEVKIDSAPGKGTRIAIFWNK